MKNLLKTGNNRDALKIKKNYGVSHLMDDIYVVKLRFSLNIANVLDERLGSKFGFNNLYITNTSNKMCRTIYGLINSSVHSALQREIAIAKAERLETQAMALRSQVELYDEWS